MSEDCWLITDGAIGNVRQCEALARALGLASERLDVTLRAPWSWLAPRLRRGVHRALGGPLGDRLAARPGGPWPSVLIAAGRRAALAAIALRARSAGACYTIQLLDPRVDPALFDLVICPRHDPAHGRNVLKTRGSLHAVDADQLAQWREHWAGRLGTLPGPRVAVLIGGGTGAVPVGEAELRALATAAGRAAGDRGTVLVTTSRRTAPALAALARHSFGASALHAEDFEENPYGGFLAWAEHLFVTPDSVNMLSEALGTGASVYCDPPPRLRGKLLAFFDWLRADGLIQPLAAAPAPASYRPLREAAGIAAEVHRRRAAAGQDGADAGPRRP